MLRFSSLILGAVVLPLCPASAVSSPSVIHQWVTEQDATVLVERCLPLDNEKFVLTRVVMSFNSRMPAGSLIMLELQQPAPADTTCWLLNLDKSSSITPVHASPTAFLLRDTGCNVCSWNEWKSAPADLPLPRALQAMQNYQPVTLAHRKAIREAEVICRMPHGHLAGRYEERPDGNQVLHATRSGSMYWNSIKGVQLGELAEFHYAPFAGTRNDCAERFKKLNSQNVGEWLIIARKAARDNGRLIINEEDCYLIHLSPGSFSYLNWEHALREELATHPIPELQNPKRKLYPETQGDSGKQMQLIHDKLLTHRKALIFRPVSVRLSTCKQPLHGGASLKQRYCHFTAKVTDIVKGDWNSLSPDDTFHFSTLADTGETRPDGSYPVESDEEYLMFLNGSPLPRTADGHFEMGHISDRRKLMPMSLWSPHLEEVLKSHPELVRGSLLKAAPSYLERKARLHRPPELR